MRPRSALPAKPVVSEPAAQNNLAFRNLLRANMVKLATKCKLGRVGSRIVAETFHRAMQGSTHSIVRDTAFKPTLGPNNTTFRMVDLLLFAFEGQAALLNPNGD